MKYLKTYESTPWEKVEKKKFWLINCKDEAYFLASLYHLRFDEDDIKNFLEKRDFVIDKYKEEKFYITTSGYMRYSDGNSYYVSNNHEFMGEIVPTKKEIELAEIKIASKKYNL